MPISYSGGGNYAAGALALMPHESFAKLEAQRNRELQFQQALAQDAEVNKLKTEQEAQAIQAYRDKIDSMPFLSPDKKRIAGVLSKMESMAYDKVKNEYGGDAAKYLSEAAMSDYQQGLHSMSPLFNQARSNVENYALAQEARKRGDNLIGAFDNNGNYVSHNDLEMQYLTGKSPSYQFNGAYKIDPTQLYGHFEKSFDPNNPYQRTQVSKEDKLTRLLQIAPSKEAAIDYWHQKNLENLPVYWGSDPLKLEALQLGGLKKQGLVNNLEMQGLRKQLLEKKVADANGQGGDGGMQYDSNPVINAESYPIIPNEYKKFNDGTDISTWANNSGAIHISKTGVSRKILQDQLGLTKDGDGAFTGNLGEVVLANGGFNKIDLKNDSGIKVVSFDSYEYFPTKYPNQKMAKMTIEMSKDKAKSLGLYDDSFFGGKKENTPLGANNVSLVGENTVRVTVFKPIGNDPLFRQMKNKAAYGQKEANASNEDTQDLNINTNSYDDN